MSNELLKIASQFEELAVVLGSLKELHSVGSEIFARLEKAESKARRGAEMTHSQIKLWTGKPAD